MSLINVQMAIPNVTQVGNGQRQALVILPSHRAFYGWTQEDCSHVSEDVPCQEHLLLQYRITKDHPKALAWKVNSHLWYLTWLHCIFGRFPRSDLKGLLELSNHCYVNVTSLQWWHGDAMKMFHAPGGKKKIYEPWCGLFHLATKKCSLVSKKALGWRHT